MDSLTQLVLGASVSVAVMGRRTAVWKAAIWGGVLGTLPDLDALIDHGDAVLNMVLHRAETHALFYLLLASAPLAWLISRIQGEAALFKRWWWAVVLVLITHTLLDAMTVYGTQLALPFSNHPYGVGSLFIIDPAYTLPLLLGVIVAVAWRTRGLQFNTWALALSTAYAGWSVAAQAYVTQHAHASLAQAGISTQQVLVTPAPLSTLLWRVVAMEGDTYHEGFYALLDRGRPIRFTSHPSGQALLQEHGHHPHVQRLQAFNHGFVRARMQDGHLWLADLRMGQEPSYVFDFDLGPPIDPGQAHRPAVQVAQRIDLDRGLPWLRQRMLGQDVPSLADASASQPPSLTDKGSSDSPKPLEAPILTSKNTEDDTP